MKQQRWLLASAFLSGGAALIYEVAYAKGLSLIIGSGVHAYSLILATFLWGMGFGSLAAKRALKRVEPARLLIALQAGIALTALAFIPLINAMDIAYVKIFLIADGRFLLFQGLLVILCVSVLLVPAFLMGMTFPVLSVLVARLERLGRDIGLLFSINTLGGVIGSFLAGFVLFPTFGLERTILVGAGFNILAGLTIFLVHQEAYKQGQVLVATLCITVFLVISSMAVHLDPYGFGVYYKVRNHQSLDEYREWLADDRANMKILFEDFGLYGHVMVRESNGYRHLKVNGKTDAGTGGDMTTQLLLGYIPLALHPSPDRVAVIGLGSGATVSATATFDAKEIDVFEINPEVVTASAYFAQATREPLKDPRVHLLVGDARNYFLASRKKYDVIISEPSNPWIEGEGFLFTRDFYRLVRKRLAPGGVFTQWIGAYDLIPDDLNVLLRTMHEVFPHTQIWSEEGGSDIFIIGSDERVSVDYRRMREHMEKPVVSSDFAFIGQYAERQQFEGPDLLLSFFVAEIGDLEEHIAGAGVSTDDRPVIEFRAGRNRIKSTPNNLLALLEALSRGADVIRTKPPVRNFLAEEGGRLTFFDISLPTPLGAHYQGAYNFEIRMRPERTLSPKFSLKIENEETLYVFAHPQGPPTAQDFAGIASMLGADVAGGGSRRELSGERVHGTLQYCDGHLYIAYFNHDAEADIAEMKGVLSSMRCIAE